jgi:MoaA/NifB/PqqE/SkfB family radical SAM enzyme
MRRAVNLAINSVELHLRRRRLLSYPPYLKIDPSVRCQLRCVGCPQVSDKFRASLPKKGFLAVDEFKKIVRPLAKTTIAISLSQFGEPLLNKDILSMVEFAHSLRIGVHFPTNFSLKFSDAYLEQLVKSGLDKLTVALDGASKETYDQYRVGGNFDLVTRNVRRLSDMKRRLKSRTPLVEWKFVVFDHNEHETEVVRTRFREWGFDSHSLVYDRHGESSRRVRLSRYAARKPCFWLYNTMHVDCDGTVRPCCGAPDWRIGNALETDSAAVWNSCRYQELRAGFGFRKYGQNMDPLCRKCSKEEPA